MKLRKEMENVLKVFNLEEVEEESKIIFDSCLEYMNDTMNNIGKEKINVEYKVIIYECDRIAAYADKIDGNYRVSMNMASWFIIYSFCHCIVMQPNFYKTISFEEEIIESSQSKYADILTVIMIKILFYHELGHVFNGHIDYIKDKERIYIETENGLIDNSIPLFSYEGRKARPFLKPEMWQALEWNADDFSVTKMVEQCAYDENIKELGLKDSTHGILLLIVAFIALYTLMEMGIQVSKPEEYKDKEHLPKRVRLNKAIDTIFESFNIIYNEEIRLDIVFVKKEFVPWVERWTEMFMCTYFVDYNEENLKIENNKEELDTEHMDYYNKVDVFYSRHLYRELENYSYMEICDGQTYLKGTLLNMIAQMIGEDKINDIEIEGIIDGKIIKF